MQSVIRPHRMHEMRTIVIDDHVEWVSINLNVSRATFLSHSLDGATSMRPLLHYCSHLLHVCANCNGISLSLVRQISLLKIFILFWHTL